MFVHCYVCIVHVRVLYTCIYNYMLVHVHLRTYVHCVYECSYILLICEYILKQKVHYVHVHNMHVDLTI